ncbi:hypothetical protein Ancab_001754 [Ancistrocladus abbreviatus]
MNNSKKQELVWVLVNQSRIHSIYLSVPTGNVDAFPVSVTLPPISSKVITLSGIPTSVEPITVPGCILHCVGVVNEHLFWDVGKLLLGAVQELVLSDPFVHGEIRDLWMSLDNAVTVPVEQACISLSGKNQDAAVSVA